MSDLRCECGAVDYTECMCSFSDSDDITIAGSGNLNPLVPTPRVDPATDNLWTLAGDGNLVELPDYIRNPPRCSAYNSANQSTTNDTPFVVALNSEYYDSATMHDTATNNSRVTFLTAGVYVVTFAGSFAANATGDRSALIRKNGNEFLGGSEKKAASASFETGLIVGVQEFFEVDEYVEAVVKQDSGGALNLLATRYSPILAAVFRRTSPFD